MKPLSRDQRRESILDAASTILNERGLDAVTMPEIASSIGVSRQILYVHFHSIDDVLEALYERTFAEYFGDLHPVNPSTATGEEGLRRLRRVMELPAPIQRVLHSAYFVGPWGRPALTLIRARLDELIESHWTRPLVASGLPRPIVRSAMASVFATTLEFRELIDRGELTLEEALAQLARLSASLFTPFPEEAPAT